MPSTSSHVSCCASSAVVCRTAPSVATSDCSAAIDRGFDESMVSHLEDPEHSGLPERQQIVLRLANAFLKAPTSFSAEDRAVLEQHYTPEQIAELLLDLVRFRPGSKLTVASGREPDIDGLVYA